MARTCTVCTHPRRAEIDQALVNGEAYRHIASRFGVTTTALQRHKEGHLPQALAKAKEAEEAVHGDDLLKQLRDLHKITMALLGRAVKAEDLRTAAAFISQARQNLELLAKLLGELEQGPSITLTISPEWTLVRGALLEALAPYAEARVAVSARLVALEGGRDRAHGTGG